MYREHRRVNRRLLLLFLGRKRVHILSLSARRNRWRVKRGQTMISSAMQSAYQIGDALDKGRLGVVRIL